jgi:hypothetical protein
VLTAYQYEGTDYRELGTWGSEDHVRLRIPPFDAVELDLPSLWVPLPPTSEPA